MGLLDKLRMLAVVSVRNVYSHKVKSSIVGLIIFFGTVLVVLGTALIDSIERGMAQSITASLAGHLQIYSDEAKDELALFGGGFMGADDIGRIDDFDRLRSAVAQVPNVKAAVPMGIDMATMTSTGDLERALGALRAAVRDGDPGPIPNLKEQVREIVEQMKAERRASLGISSNRAELESAMERLEAASGEAFWAGFDADPLGALERLDTQVAPLAEDGRLLYFRYVGTDLDLFTQHFDRFQIVKGEAVPPHTRGFLLNDRFYEEWVKHIVARTLDKLAREMRDGRKRIDNDAALASLVRQMARQQRRISYQLDAVEAAEVEAELRLLFPEETGDLDALLKRFLTVDDESFEARYAFFYRVIAPKLDLYDLRPGDTVTIRAFTRSGFLKAVNVKVYGTFQFDGLERSDLAGSHSLIDLVTFRELYGLMTDAKKAELVAIKDEVGLAEVSADDAEAALFGSARVEAAAAGEGFDEFADVDLGGERERQAAELTSGFTQEELDKGLALNVAVILEDPSKLEESRVALADALKGSGFAMRVVDWQAASGIVGQFIVVIRAVLYIAIFIIFTVALVIINNSMVMATMERVTEIGTMRAIGASKGLVIAMFLLETLALGLLAGGLGLAAGAGLVKLMALQGVPAPSEELIFMFGGPRLYPTAGASSFVFGLVAVLAVSLISTFYPAFMAAQIQPVTAMRAKE